jgi:signal transduction histidine kinase
LQLTQAQIIAQEKLASLGALTAGIAHEIKNPLNFVNNFAELSVDITSELNQELANQMDRLDPYNRTYIEELLHDLAQNAQKIKEHGERADNIVHGMLMHSRGHQGERQLTDINLLLADAINLVYHGIRAKNPTFDITIETHYEEHLPSLTVVPQNISRAFLNILGNACDAAYAKAERVGAGFVPQIQVITQDGNGQIQIRIRDNGNGIAQEIITKIFDPFFTTKPTGQGTGLGLSISHDIIVQEHQGSLRVETEVGNYAEFIITLPKASN